jgi:type VI secretion system protein ImpF
MSGTGGTSGMRGGQPRSVLRPSLLQRLIGEDGEARPTEDLRIGLRELRREVLRDLEALLNTRVALHGSFDEHPEVRDSILAYGMPDVSTFSQSSENDMKHLTELIADIVRRFEPRLDGRSVRVERATDEAAALSGKPAQEPITNVRFRIHAVLHVEPLREHVTFDTRIEMETGAVHVAEADA